VHGGRPGSVTSEVPMQGFGPISQISNVQDEGTASSNEAEEEEDWFSKAIEDTNKLVCQFSDVPERSMTAQVTNSDENRISASFDEAEGEVDWFSEIAEDSDVVSDDGWDSDDESSAEDHRDMSRSAHIADEPVTPANETIFCPNWASQLEVNALDSTGDLEPTKRDTEQVLDMCNSPLDAQTMGWHNHTIANDFWPAETRPLGNHKGGGSNPAVPMREGYCVEGEEPLKGSNEPNVVVVSQSEANKSSAVHFEGENKEELGETSPDVPFIPSSSIPTNPDCSQFPNAEGPLDPPERPSKPVAMVPQCVVWKPESPATLSNCLDDPRIPPGVQPSTTKSNEIDLEGEGLADSCKMANFVDLHMTTAETDEIEALKPRNGNKGSPRLNSLSTDWDEGLKFELAMKIEELCGNLPDAAEIVDSGCFSPERKDVGGEADETEGPWVPQDMPNVANFEVFETGAHVVSIQVANEITAASGIKMCQIAFREPYAISKHTLDPTKHPPGHAATHSNHNPNDFQVGRFPRNLRRSGRFLEPDAIKDCCEGICILHVGWQGPEWRRGSRLSMKEREGKAALRIAQQINEACASMSRDARHKEISLVSV